MSAAIYQALDLQRLPLRGLQLIEASAGTGKTFTIAMLYVRLVLGHDPALANRRGRCYGPAELLVLTFTEAAAGELRDRIRARLSEAALAFSQGASGDGVLQALIADYAPADHGIAAQRLREAEQRLDEAEIGTIHAWCLRVLQQHAFDSGSLFQQRLRTDIDSLRLQMVRDVWRQWFYPQAGELLQAITAIWPNPDALDQQLKGLIDMPQARLCLGDRLPSGQSWQVLSAAYLPQLIRRARAAQALWQAWQNDGEALVALLLAAHTRKDLNGVTFRADGIRGLSLEMQTWRGRGELSRAGKIHSYFAPSEDTQQNKFIDKAVKNKPIPSHPLIDQLTDFLADAPLQASLSEAFTLDVLAALRVEVAHQLDARMRAQAELSFNDVLHRLHDALAMPHGEALAATLRQRFPVALIDEFQDTDPVQFGMFKRIYVDGLTAESQALALILIGDPKQAIYSFRGADLPTYFAARAQASSPIHSLATNFRTDASVIAGINAFYALASARDGGAFAQTGGHELTYREASAHQQAAALCQRDDLHADWQSAPGMQLEYLPGAELAMSSGAAREALAVLAAERIAQWLLASDAGLMGIRDGADVRALEPGDIAILVRKGREADAMRRALASMSVPCVYGSDRDSVFASAEATALQSWLEALAHPSDERLLRLALATAPMGLSWQDLLARRQQEALWEQDIQRVQRIAALWQSHGVLAAVRQWLFEYQVPARLLHPSYVNGERALTNLLHLAEVLQEAANDLHGEHALIRYLAEQREQPGAGDEALVRLESDERRVRIVTMHQAKGLEYPLVCLPFTVMPSVAPRQANTRYHRDAELIIDLAPDDASLARARQEQLEEELRLFYVAVTRPKHLLWIGMAPVRQGMSKTIADNTAWQWLFSGHDALTTEALLAGMATLTQHPAITALDAPLSVRPWQPRSEPVMLLPAREFLPLKQAFWQIASYSRLRFQAALQTPAEANYFDEPAAIVSTAAKPQIAERPAPRGSEVGTFWHSLLELAAEANFASSPESLAVLDHALARQCAARGWQHAETDWCQSYRRWLSVPMRTHSAGLDDRSQHIAGELSDLGLAQLSAFIVEMEFWFSSEHVSTERLDALVCAHTLAQRPRPRAESNGIHGLFKGFIDLVFVHQGRYYVADYKSNYLGDDAQDYSPARLADDIAKHRYDMQYSIYLLALHRHLRARLHDYDPEQHLGGAVYLYLRGWDGAGQGVHIERPTTAFIEALDALFSGQRMPANADEVSA